MQSMRRVVRDKGMAFQRFIGLVVVEFESLVSAAVVRHSYFGLGLELDHTVAAKMEH